MNIWQVKSNFHDSSILLLKDSNEQSFHTAKKIQKMHAIYVNKADFPSTEKAKAHSKLQAFCYKFQVSNYLLEQLWALSHTRRMRVYDAILNSLDVMDTTDDELMLVSLHLENFLLQSRAFLDFYLLYLLSILRTAYEGSISREKFQKQLKISDTSKAIWLSEYFETKVFGNTDWSGMNPNDWGTLLVSLRDKVAHRDRLKYSFDGQEEITKGILHTWPTITEITYDRFCQYIQNGMFSMLEDISKQIYELEWIPGHYREDMWE
ncbi:MAG: hypothetical protein KC615_12180 [Anaerolineae bacterium]|nr:hypothetical protein [Anaerolineae bacterium]